MRKKNQDKRVALRLPSEQLEMVEHLVKNGNFKSISHVIRSALRKFLLVCE